MLLVESAAVGSNHVVAGTGAAEGERQRRRTCCAGGICSRCELLYRVFYVVRLESVVAVRSWHCQQLETPSSVNSSTVSLPSCSLCTCDGRCCLLRCESRFILRALRVAGNGLAGRFARQGSKVLPDVRIRHHQMRWTYDYPAPKSRRASLLDLLGLP